MTTITTDKRGEPTRREAAPQQQELLAAYQAHTLAQMLYGRFWMTCPWIGQAHPLLHGEPWGAAVAPLAAYGSPIWGAGPAPLPGPHTVPVAFQGFPHC